MERKFKVGDEVKVVKVNTPSACDENKYLGKKFKIKCVSSLSFARYPYSLVDDNGNTGIYGWCDEELELVRSECKFKVGDKVKVIKDSTYCAPKSYKGKVGTIVKIGYTDKVHLIEFDERISDRDNGRWYYEADVLELVEKTKVEEKDERVMLIKPMLKPRQIVKLRNGDEYWVGNELVYLYHIKDGVCSSGTHKIRIDSYDYNLKLTGFRIDRALDIVEILKPEYKTIAKREEDHAESNIQEHAVDAMRYCFDNLIGKEIKVNTNKITLRDLFDEEFRRNFEFKLGDIVLHDVYGKGVVVGKTKTINGLDLNFVEFFYKNTDLHDGSDLIHTILDNSYKIGRLHGREHRCRYCVSHTIRLVERRG